VRRRSAAACRHCQALNEEALREFEPESPKSLDLKKGGKADLGELRVTSLTFAT
jgi:hypothetical protein